MEVGMELRALRAHHAVDGPDATFLAKRTVLGRVPVPRGEDRQAARSKLDRIAVQDRDDLVASRYSQRAAWQEIVLDVCDQQAIAGLEVHVNPPGFLCHCPPKQVLFTTSTRTQLRFMLVFPSPSSRPSRPACPAGQGSSRARYTAACSGATGSR